MGHSPPDDFMAKKDGRPHMGGRPCHLNQRGAGLRVGVLVLAFLQLPDLSHCTSHRHTKEFRDWYHW
jgi:hypothetical protein